MKVIKGYGAPYASTRANINDLYVDLNTSDTYRCTNIKTIGEEWDFAICYAGTLSNMVHEWKLVDHVENINNQDKVITNNGTYTADEGYTGLGSITVDVTKDASAYGAGYTVNGVVSYPETTLVGYDQSTSNYVQIRLDSISSDDDYDYYLSSTGIACVINTSDDGTYTMSTPGIKYNFDKDTETSITVTLTIRVSKGTVYVKIGSGKYHAKVVWRHVTASALH